MAYIGKSPAVAALTASDITDGIISNAKLAQDIMSAESELTSAPASTDEFLLSDAGVLKRIDASLVGKGKLLQIQSTLYESSSEGSTTSTSYVDSGITDSITPSATSSKIFVMATINGHRVSSTAINSILNIERDIGGTTADDSSSKRSCTHL